MATKRGKALFNLTWLLGSMLLLCGGLFTWGLYLGEVYRLDVLAFERNYLAWTGITEGAPAYSEWAATPASGPPLGPTSAAPTGAGAPLPPGYGVVTPLPGASPTGQTAPANPTPWAGSDGLAWPNAPRESALQSPVEPSGAAPSPQVAPGVPYAPPGMPQVGVPSALAPTNPAPAIAPGQPLPPGQASAAVLDDARSVPVTLTIKALVDPRLSDARGEWLLRVQRTVASASAIYRADFGIALELNGAVRWSRTLDGLSGSALHAELVRHPREGADVLLGLVGVELDPAVAALGAPTVHAPWNGAAALVGMTSDPELPHLRTMLRSLGYLLGAQRVSDPASDAFRLGSWMSDALPHPSRAPWIDLDNRRRILERKARPTEPER